jgi:hypothetical protein
MLPCSSIEVGQRIGTAEKGPERDAGYLIGIIPAECAFDEIG